MNQETNVPVEISARHIHLTNEDIEALFGKGYVLQSLKKLSQGADFAAKETVEVEANGQVLKKVRIVGEPRENTQLEITLTDARQLKMKVPIRLSGNVAGSPGFKILGPPKLFGRKSLVKKEGMIVAKRHLHLSPQEAEKLGLRSGDRVSVECGGEERRATLHNCEVRVKEGFKMAVHIDTDEANAIGLESCGIGKLVRNGQ